MYQIEDIWLKQECDWEFVFVFEWAQVRKPVWVAVQVFNSSRYLITLFSFLAEINLLKMSSLNKVKAIHETMLIQALLLLTLSGLAPILTFIARQCESTLLEFVGMGVDACTPF